MGGGVTYQAIVAKPGLVDAAVVYAPVSSDAVENFDRWTRGQAERRALADEVVAAYGAPEDAPEFWREVSPRTYFDRVTEPVLIHHGTADESCPIAWSEETHEAMVAAGVDAELFVYDGEPHAFEAAWPLSMERTVAFLREHLVARG
jgi:dipeptidyl aminopeptidase/acylaminoacyl peptidase